MVMLLVEQLGGQLAGMMIVDHADDGDLLAAAVLGLLADEAIADQIANRLAAHLVALGGDVAVEGLQQGVFQGNADSRQFGHDCPKIRFGLGQCAGQR